MFCRQRNIREIDMAIVLRIAVMLVIVTLNGGPAAVEARASTRMLHHPHPVAATDATEKATPFIDSNSIQGPTESTVSDSRSLKRVFLSNRTVTCNDGSQAGYYMRRPLIKSKRWVVFFEGGWHCFDFESCNARWNQYRNLMTSANWPETRDDVGGILSPIAAENPYWHDANHIFVPYCTSDSWSGTRVNVTDRFSFMGALIVHQVMADLIPLGLRNSHGGDLMLAGSSAGGLGVMLNLDRVKKFIREEQSINIAVRGVSDSGWFLDREPFAPGSISAVEMVKQGYEMWQGQLPEACVAQHAMEPWRCYFGHRIYQSTKAPLFIFQWLFDEAQMRADHVGTPVTKKQWDFIHETGIALRSSLDNVTAVFAPSCVGHAVLSRRDWLNIRIDDYSLPAAIRCWERSTGRGNKDRRASDDQSLSQKRHQQRERRRRHKERQRRKQQRQQERLERQQERQRLAKERVQRQKKQQQQQQKRRTGSTKNLRRSEERAAVAAMQRTQRSSATNETALATSNHSSLAGQKRKAGQRSEEQRRLRRQQRQQEKEQMMKQLPEPEPSRCNLRLLERCSWPQCNQSCPNLTNPLTGKEMRFLELLSSFGLDINAVAMALGVDMTTLSNMDRTELLSMLTQPS